MTPTLQPTSSITHTPDRNLWAEIHAGIYGAICKHGRHWIASPAVSADGRLAILTEELGEVANAILERGDVRGELLDVAVCAVGWAGITDWRVIQQVMEGHTLRWGDLAPDAPGLPDALRLAHLGDHHGRLSGAVLHVGLQPDLWTHVIHAALVDIAATACAWIEAIDA